jgi:hypothetical protein
MLATGFARLNLEARGRTMGAAQTIKSTGTAGQSHRLTFGGEAGLSRYAFPFPPSIWRRTKGMKNFK